MHPIIAVADALTSWLQAQTFSQSITVTRRALVRFDLKDLVTCQVSVVPADWDEQTLSRRATQRKFQIDVAVQQKVDATSIAATDALLNLVWEIEQTIKFVRLATTPPAQWTGVQKVPGAEPGYAPQHLGEELRTFTSIRRHTFVPEGG